MSIPSWIKSQRSQIWIFNVGRGLCIFIRTGLNQGMMYDFGSSSEFNPADFIKEHFLPYLDKYKKCCLAQTFISHPHADHISNIQSLSTPDINKSAFYSSLHTCPHCKNDGASMPEAINWNRVQNPKGNEDNIEAYKSLYEKRKLPLQTVRYESPRSIPNLEYGFYYVRPPVVEELYPENDQEYGNGLSIVVYYRHGYHTLLIPGDINPDTFKHLLDEGKGLEKRYTKFDRSQNSLYPSWHECNSDQPSLKSLLESYGLSVLLAPHHGLESGFSEDLYKAIKDNKPGLVAISEKRHMSKTDGKVDEVYQSANGAFGQKVFIDGKEDYRYSVSTRNGYHILIQFQGTGGNPEVFLEKDPERLLTKMK